MRFGGETGSWAMSVPQALILDFDGIVLDSESPIYEAWRTIWADHDQILNLAEYNACVGADHGAWDPLAALEARVERKLDEGALMDQRRALIDVRLERAEPMEGVVKLLHGARERDIPVAIGSSSPHRWVDGWLEQLHLAEYVVSTHCRDDVERIKPAPDLFLRAASALSVAPAHALVIEDSINGLRAAQAAGIRCVAVPNPVTRGGDFSGAWLQLNSLADWDWNLL